jgi:hypothetical protein
MTKKHLKSEVFSLLENRTEVLLAKHEEYRVFSRTEEYKEGKKIHDFGFRISEKARKYTEAHDFLQKYSWLKKKHEYYKVKYPHLVFFDEYLNDHYFFEKYKNGSTSKVRMSSCCFSGNIKGEDLEIIENNLLGIDNEDRMVYHHFHTNYGETRKFKGLKEKEKKLVLSDDDNWRFVGVDIVCHSSFLYSNKPEPSQFFAVFVCPVNKGYLILHKLP